jgi:23S rRNA (uracil1939-C5)-methyltransferase
MTNAMNCPHALTCPGCPAIAKTAQEQNQQKRDRLLRAWQEQDLPTSITPLVPSPLQWGYRRRAKWVAEPRSAGEEPGSVKTLAIGLYGPDHKVLDLPSCKVITPAIAKTTHALRTELATLVWASDIVGLDLRECQEDPDADPALLLTLIVSDPSPTWKSFLHHPVHLANEAQNLLRRVPLIRGIAMASRGRASVRLLDGAPHFLAGERTLVDHTGLAPFQASFGAFVQANHGQAQAIIQAIVAEVGSSKVLELFGGSGAIGLSLAAQGAKVTMVESYEPAVAAANASASAEPSTRANFQAVVADLEDPELDSLQTELARLSVDLEGFDWVVVNPPRRGLSPQLRRRLAETLPTLRQRIAYVSCDPDTLARDAADLLRLGFAATSVTPFDMMPQTEEVETLAFFERTETAPSTSTRPSAADREQTSTFLLLVRGVTRRKGKLLQHAHFERVRVVGGHTLIQLRIGNLTHGRETATEARLKQAISRLAKLNHPLIGSTHDARTAAYFRERYTLDRPFLHRLITPFADQGPVETTLPGDLKLVLRRIDERAR